MMWKTIQHNKGARNRRYTQRCGWLPTLLNALQIPPQRDEAGRGPAVRDVMTHACRFSRVHGAPDRHVLQLTYELAESNMYALSKSLVNVSPLAEAPVLA